MEQTLNKKPKTLILLEKKHRRNTSKYWHSNNFMDGTPMETKAKMTNEIISNQKAFA
jgi:hypothetical protein